MMTACASSTIPSPVLKVSENCKVVAKDLPAAPDKTAMESPTEATKFTASQLKNGVGPVALTTILVPNNQIAQTNVNNLVYLQDYITKLQNSGVISK